VLNFKKNAAN
jgi:hypothetical protein